MDVRMGLRRVCALGLGAALAGTLFGCSGAGSGAGSNETQVSDGATSAIATTADDDSVAMSVDDPAFAAYDLGFTERDLDPSYDESAAVRISLAGTTATVEGDASGVTVDGSTVTIAQEGVYVLSGTLDDGQVVVACDEEAKAKVQLVLDGVSIHNSDGPVIRVDEAKKCFITLADGSANTVSDGADYVLDADSDEPYSTIYSRCDLTLQGTGSLEVQAGYRHGIVSKDDLVVTGGTYVITAPEVALRGRDCVKVAGGTFDLASGETAVKSNNDEDADAGYVYVAGGTFDISAGNDGIHAETLLLVDGGDINIARSCEGLEGAQFYLRGGDIDVTSSDDGVNASDGSGMPGGSDLVIDISGGTIHVNAEGDGIDSNGSIVMSGGTLYVDGPTSGGDSAIDYETTATITGGTVIAAGSVGMAEGFTDGTQAFALVNASGSAGSAIEVKDASGNVVASMTAGKQFQCVVVSGAGLEADTTCTVEVDGVATSFTPSTEAQAQGMGGGDPGAGGDPGMGGGGPQGGDPQGQTPPQPR